MYRYRTSQSYDALVYRIPYTWFYAVHIGNSIQTETTNLILTNCNPIPPNQHNTYVYRYIVKLESATSHQFAWIHRININIYTGSYIILIFDFFFLTMKSLHVFNSQPSTYIIIMFKVIIIIYNYQSSRNTSY